MRISRKHQRLLTSLACLFGGWLLVKLGGNRFEPVAAGWLIMAMGALAFLGFNVWKDGPLDARFDSLPEEEQKEIADRQLQDSARSDFAGLAILSPFPLIMGWDFWESGKIGWRVALCFLAASVLLGLIAFLGLRETKGRR